MSTSGHDHGHDHGHSHDACDSESLGLTTDLSRIEALVGQGVHRIGDHEGPFSLHVLGIGKTGANVIESMIASHSAGGVAAGTDVAFDALAIDIGDAELTSVTEALAAAPDRVSGQTVNIPALDNATLFNGLRRYREFLKTEYPRYYWNPNYEPWLPNDLDIPAAGSHFPRAVSKALYGVDYYTGGDVAVALDEFADKVLDSKDTPIVCVVFSLAGGTGSGIVVELARHLSNIRLGRRALVLGIGVLPSDGDPVELNDGRTFITINELDCMVDADKNKGVMTVWGDLYKNPFTAGFFAVPQNAVYEETGSVEHTHARIDQGLSDFVLRDGGLHLYESIKALNWLNVPANAWHPATRGDQTDKWISLLSVGASAGNLLSAQELTDTVVPEFAEVRLFGAQADDSAASDAAQGVTSVVSTLVGPTGLGFATSGPESVSLYIPRLSKLDLKSFVPSRVAYDSLEWEEKLMRHSWLLDLGVLLCEPSTRFEGVGGECLLGCACWVVVPHAAIRGELDLVAG